MNLRMMKEQHTDKVAALRGLIPEAGDPTTEQLDKFDSLKKEVTSLEDMIKRAEYLEDLERRSQATPVTGRDFERAKADYSVMKVIQRQMGVEVDCGREMEVSQELAKIEGRSTEGFFAPYSIFERRDTITTKAPASGPGGNLVATTLMPGQFIDMLAEANPINSLGVRHLTGLVGNVDIPKQIGETEVGFFAENTDMGETEASFDKVSLAPKHVGAYTQISRNMILQTTPDMETLLRADLARVLGLKLADVTINGAGGVEPAGILKTVGIQKVATAPTEPMEVSTELADALFLANVGNVAFVVNSGEKKDIDNLLTTDGLPIGSSAYFRGANHVYFSKVPAANKMIAGDFSQVIIGQWGGVEILTNPYMESAYKKGNLAIRIILTVDVAIRHAEAFATFGA